jgi:tetratricopeptide (TPR) repeat protein
MPGEMQDLIFSPVAAPPAPNVATAAHERAWEMLLHSKELYEQRDFDNAISLLKQAIKLEPAQGDFYYLLGLCQSESEVMKNDAEINLKKAIELKSWSADPVYALGILYHSQDKMKLAERCFQRVKEIAYDHTGASRALVDLRRQKAGSKSKTPWLKKKIF